MPNKTNSWLRIKKNYVLNFVISNQLFNTFIQWHESSNASTILTLSLNFVNELMSAGASSVKY